jgi:FKBP-type peptidyl-prolyl cis-trans isomerase (trigger factor)
MKVEVKKVDNLRRELRIEVPREKVTKAMDDVYNEIGKYAKIKGFRPGKVPRHILTSSHGKMAHEETIKKLIPEAYHQGIGEQKLDPIDLPEISNVDLKDGVLTFTATLDLRPEVKIEKYKGIKVKPQDNKVTEEELNKTLEFFKKGQGDKEVTIDDAFAKGMGFPGLVEFKEALTRQLQMDKDRKNRMEIENQIVEELVKNAKLDVPQSLVKRQLIYRTQETLKRFKNHGLSADELKNKEEEIRKELEKVVERDVKVYLILEEIGKLEKIEVKENEHVASKVIELLLKEAKWEEAK